MGSPPGTPPGSPWQPESVQAAGNSIKEVALRNIKPTRRLRQFCAEPLSDLFLARCLQFAQAHIHRVKLLQAPSPGLRKSAGSDDDPQAAEEQLQAAEAQRAAALRELGLAYSDVLRYNLAFKFEQQGRYDESAFFEMLYKLVNVAMLHAGVAPTGMRKELEVALGEVFRGKDFNLEAKGFMRGSKPGAWQPQPSRPKRQALRSVSRAVQSRSPAVLSVHPDTEAVLAQMAEKRRQATSRLQRSAPASPVVASAEFEVTSSTDSVRPIIKLLSDLNMRNQPVSLEDFCIGKVQLAPSARPRTATTHRARPQTAVSRQVSSAAQRPKTAVARPSTQTVGSRFTVAAVRPKSAARPKTAVRRPVSKAQAGRATSRPRTAVVRSSWDVRPAMKNTTATASGKVRPKSANVERAGVGRRVKYEEQPAIKPWAAHEMWKPAVSVAF